MTLAILAGVGIASGIAWFVSAVRPRPIGVSTLIEIMSGATPVSGTSSLRGWRELLGVEAARRLAASPLDTPALRSDLAMCGVTIDQLAGEMAVAGVGAGLAFPVAWMLMGLAGISIPWVLPAFVCVAATAGGFAVPWFALRQRASDLRRQFRRALSTYLELVSLEMAGAMGVEGALDGAATISEDGAFRRIGAAIEAARNRGRPPWEALGALGEEIAVPEVVELAANIGLAGSEGARVRDTLSSKASTLRRREMAEAEAEANSTTEKMFVPGVILLAGFMIFVGYPAIVHVFNTL